MKTLRALKLYIKNTFHTTATSLVTNLRMKCCLTCNGNIWGSFIRSNRCNPLTVSRNCCAYEENLLHIYSYTHIHVTPWSLLKSLQVPVHIYVDVQHLHFLATRLLLRFLSENLVECHSNGSVMTTCSREFLTEVCCHISVNVTYFWPD